jgi:NAD(P)-dependent dehydrogenase (short-subunit alcohol dehydrogenase family)
MEFQDKVVIITGGASGIGRASALAFAREGARVLIADIDAEATDTLVEGIRSWGGIAQGISGDVTREADAARITNETVSSFGGIDVLINNVGVQTHGTVESTTLEAWNATLAVNLTSVYLMSHFVVPEMRRRGGGAIVNMASIQGLACEPNVAAYAASKGGVIALTRTMALDYANENIRVNSVCPGWVDTPLLHASAHASGQPADVVLQQRSSMKPMGRFGSPDEIAQVVLFLAGPRSSFVTGAAYTVDGGLSARL